MNWMVVLPPSESKRIGGDDWRLSLDSLSFQELAAPRRHLVERLTKLSVDEQMDVLRLKPKQRTWAVDNTELLEAPTMRALERYTGVVYSAIAAGEFDASLWQAATEHLAIGSALWGILRAHDQIPRYRLSSNHRLVVGGWNQWWQSPLDAAFQSVDGPILDLRSNAYLAIGGRSVSTITVEVVDAQGGRPLNHWNKHAKGIFALNLLRQSASGESFDPSVAAAMGDQRWTRLDGTHAQLAVEAPVKSRLTAPSLSQ